MKAILAFVASAGLLLLSVQAQVEQAPSNAPLEVVGTDATKELARAAAIRAAMGKAVDQCCGSGATREERWASRILVADPRHLTVEGEDCMESPRGDKYDVTVRFRFDRDRVVARWVAAKEWIRVAGLPTISVVVFADVAAEGEIVKAAMTGQLLGARFDVTNADEFQKDAEKKAQEQGRRPTDSVILEQIKNQNPTDVVVAVNVSPSVPAGAGAATGSWNVTATVYYSGSAREVGAFAAGGSDLKALGASAGSDVCEHVAVMLSAWIDDGRPVEVFVSKLPGDLEDKLEQAIDQLKQVEGALRQAGEPRFEDGFYRRTLYTNWTSRPLAKKLVELAEQKQLRLALSVYTPMRIQLSVSP